MARPGGAAGERVRRRYGRAALVAALVEAPRVLRADPLDAALLRRVVPAAVSAEVEKGLDVGWGHIFSLAFLLLLSAALGGGHAPGAVPGACPMRSYAAVKVRPHGGVECWEQEFGGGLRRGTRWASSSISGSIPATVPTGAALSAVGSSACSGTPAAGGGDCILLPRVRLERFGHRRGRGEGRSLRRAPAVPRRGRACDARWSLENTADL